MWWLYQALVFTVLVVAGPILLLRRRERDPRPVLAGRFGVGAAGQPGGESGALWIHAVSVGEVGVAQTLARALPADLPLVVTTVTPTGQQRARQVFAGRAAVAWHPFELGFAVQRFWRRHRPRALVLCEGDLWPLVLRRARRDGVPVAVVNGRISDRSFPRLRLVRPLVRRLLLDPVERFGVQTALDRQRLLDLGVDAARIEVTGNLKFEAPEAPELPELAALLERLAAGRPRLVAGSTMAGEETAVLEAFAAAGGGARALLVLAPRHPERFDAVAAEVAARFGGAVRRSDPAAAAASAPPVLVLDTLGELAAAYRGAAGAFIGGTLVPTGGHNPIEAARLGVPVVAGPSMVNFREIAGSFDAAEGWVRVADGPALGSVWRAWLDDPATARRVGERGAALVAAHRGALARTLALIEPLVTAARVPAG